MGEATKEWIEDARVDGAGGRTEYTASEVLNRTQRSQKAEAGSGHGPEELPCPSRVGRADHQDTIQLFICKDGASWRASASPGNLFQCPTIPTEKKYEYIFSHV